MTNRLASSSIPAMAAMRRAMAASLLAKISRTKFSSRSFAITPFYWNQPSLNPLPQSRYVAKLHPHLLLFRRDTQTSTTPSFQPPALMPPQSEILGSSLDAAATADEYLSAFKLFESSLSEDDERLGLASLKVAEHLYSEAPDELEKALSFGVRALEVLGRKHGGGSLPLVKALRLVGSISCKLRRFDESLESLKTADQILDSMEEDGFGCDEFDSMRIGVQLELASTKIAMGRRWDAMINLRRSLQLRTMTLKPDSLELGAAFKDMAEAYAGVLKFCQALPLCLKALGIFEAKLGKNCEEVVKIRQLLGAIHIGLGENENALKQNELCQKILRSLGLEAELLSLEIEAANIQIALGRAGEAMNILKGVIQNTGKESETRAFAYVSMAKALFDQNRMWESKGCLDMSCGILNKVDSTSPGKVADVLAEISMLYETMNDFESSISLLRRTITVLEELPQELYLMGSIFARMGWLLLLTGTAQDAVPSLERAVVILKNSFGPKHFGLGFAYKHLGQAYLEINKTQSAIQVLLIAKDILDESFGRHHEDSIDACQCIANAYGIMRSYGPAMEFQQEVLDRWETCGPDARDEFREAYRLLGQLKRKAQGSVSAVFPANSLPECIQRSEQ
ncbi:hypothetical protein AXF42_Ash021112 [Apostasia shenzhenica]|uniref:MalT-like TPR region domain-containing protein n=1 Tax=Apostasia shenzhenica TaxID=1088818 RepID=A0A2H9ZWY9_9ASPA|nr:hypothetical protein AXF42_Ash021112 [Apostasia shenzhenica]